MNKGRTSWLSEWKYRILSIIAWIVIIGFLIMTIGGTIWFLRYNGG